MEVSREFDRALAYHCAPSLVGIKPADLISWPKTPLAQRRVAEYGALLEKRGICLRVLRHGRNRSLVLVYRPQRLKTHLECPLVRAMLAQDGYPVEGEIEDMLRCLSKRLSQQEFPHEIGLFLGYPPADVEGFRRHRGQNYKVCGWWKVYGDAEAAITFFNRCDRCRAALCRQIQAGRSLPEVFCAG